MRFFPKNEVMWTFMIFVILFCSELVWAQVDAGVMGMSTGSGPSQRNVSQDDELKHYVKKRKPQVEQELKEHKARRRKINSVTEDQHFEPVQNESGAPVISPLPQLTSRQPQQENPTQPSVSPIKESEGFGNKMRDLVLGGDLEQIDKYRTYLDVEDARKNIFDFTLAPYYQYNTSLSPYYYRNYINQSPGAYFNLNLWLTPFLAIDTDYRFSLLNEVRSSPTADTYDQISHTWFKVGLKFKRYFSMLPNSSSLSLGMHYVSRVLSFQPGSQRPNQQTRGVQLSVDTLLSSGKAYFWNLGFMVQPFITHTEAVLASDVRAGSSNQTYGFGFNIGGEYRFSRQVQVFLKLSTVLEKSQFSGAALATDPLSGSVPTNVPVSNVFYFFDFGVRFGN